MEATKTKAILEALILAADEPVSVRRLSSFLPEVDTDEVKSALAELQEEYGGHGNVHGVELVQVAGGWRFRTRQDLAPWVGRMFQQSPLRLSRAMLEVLAIVAYRQPITRAEIESVRGVDSSGSLRSLMERELVRIVGRKEMPGRPQLYGTTKTFLDVFSLSSLRDLPPLEEELADLQQKLPLSALPEGSVEAARTAVDGEQESSDGLTDTARGTEEETVRDVRVRPADAETGEGTDSGGEEPEPAGG